MAVGTLPLLIALAAMNPDFRTSVLACRRLRIAALLALSSALVLLPHSTHPIATALFSAAGTLPVLASRWPSTG